MSDLSIPAQTALIQRYRGDATLQGLMTGATAPEWNIFDQGGNDSITPVFPSIFAHPITMAMGSLLVMGADGSDLYMLVNTYTKTEGFNLARQIASRLYNITHDPQSKNPLVLSSGVSALILFENRQELEEVQDGLVQHIADRYKLLLQG